MVKNTIILLVSYFLLFYINSFEGKKNISPNLTNSYEPEPHVFGPLEPLEKKGAGAAWEKKWGAGAGKK